MDSCKVRSCHPVTISVKPICPKPPSRSAGCPKSSMRRCGQYEKDPCPDTTCKPLIPPFYETDRQRGRKNDRCPPCCMALPPPPPDYRGAPCNPPPKCHQLDGNMCTHELPSSVCKQVFENKPPKCGQQQQFHSSCPPYDTHLPCKQEIVMEQQCPRSCMPQIPPCWQNVSQNANNCPSAGRGGGQDGFRSNGIGCYGYKSNGAGYPGHQSNTGCDTKRERSAGCKPQIPPCWQDMFDIQPRRQDECHKPTRCEKQEEMSCLPAAIQLSFPQCPPTCMPRKPQCNVPDNRGALRPDIRDCPALGRNFCVHEPDPPRDMCSECWDPCQDHPPPGCC